MPCHIPVLLEFTDKELYQVYLFGEAADGTKLVY